MINLPLPTKLESSKSQLLFTSLKKEIKNDNGLISFSKFMDIVLYHAEFGYYTGNQEKFGIGGDFITAPMISDIFAETFLSVFNKIVLASSAQVLELGAGNA
ncbi:MAG: class I SAM-dependent methyltransferase, partial [Methylophilaceae bacterium]